MPEGPRFEDRHDAGRQLAEQLVPYREEDPIVLALPRGGVALGYEIAKAFRAPLDVVVARKVGAPGHEELGIGAVAPGVTHADGRALSTLGIDEDAFAALAEEARQEMRRRLHAYRGEENLPDVAGRTVILIDDGLATGVTATAAVCAVRQKAPRWLVLAVAVCARETAEPIRVLVDDLVCLHTPERLGSVGRWYCNFSQTTDEEVLDLLERVNTLAGRR